MVVTTMQGKLDLRRYIDGVIRQCQVVLDSLDTWGASALRGKGKSSDASDE